MKNLNLNELAVYIAEAEAGKEEISIAQIKEIINILGNRWKLMDEKEALKEFELIKSNVR